MECMSSVHVTYLWKPCPNITQIWWKVWHFKLLFYEVVTEQSLLPSKLDPWLEVPWVRNGTD